MIHLAIVICITVAHSRSGCAASSRNHPVQPQSHHPLRPHCIKSKRKSHTCESAAILTVEVGPPASSSNTKECGRMHWREEACMMHKRVENHINPAIAQTLLIRTLPKAEFLTSLRSMPPCNMMNMVEPSVSSMPLSHTHLRSARDILREMPHAQLTGLQNCPFALPAPCRPAKQCSIALKSQEACNLHWPQCGCVACLSRASAEHKHT